MPGNEVDLVIIGAGVVGAAVAARLATRGKSVVIVEKNPRPGCETSARNSGVIHAGLYYPPASLKTRLCIEGNRLLYDWAAAHDVPHRRIGKLVVATTADEETALAALYTHAQSVGVPALELLGQAALKQREPDVTGRAAIFSGSTGIIDTHALVQSLLIQAVRAGAEVVCQAQVRAIEANTSGYTVVTDRGPLQAAQVVNAAGLHADAIATLAGITGYRIYPCRGDYFRLRRPARYTHLVYPTTPKHSPGLGVHLTLDLGGGCRLGPDIEWVTSKTDYSPAEHKRAAFAQAARRLLGEITEDDLEYDGCGIRPKLRGPGETVERDFVIVEEEGRPGFIMLAGIDSPGLTSALAIAAEVERLLIG